MIILSKEQILKIHSSLINATGGSNGIRDEGILIGISARTKNSAEIVYAQPELEGESINKNIKDFYPD